MTVVNAILQKLKGGLIVSCQALEKEPMHSSFIMGRFAVAAAEGGAVGIRANGISDITEIKKQVKLPVIGIVKKDYADSEVYITPTKKEIDELLDAEAEVIAMDATLRKRPGGADLKDLVAYIRKSSPDTAIMADIADEADLMYAAAIGFDLIGTTLRGYTAATKETTIPDIGFIERAVRSVPVPLVAEGGIREPKELKEIFSRGVFAAVIGGAITRPQNITRRFVDAISNQ